MNTAEYKEIERVLGSIGIMPRDEATKSKVIEACYDVCGSDKRIETVSSDCFITSKTVENYISHSLFGFLCGIVFERKYIKEQLRIQEIALLVLDH
jgi:hypothetical protein